MSFWDKAWANQILRIAIAQVNNVGRDLSARRVEVHYWLSILESEGFYWQAARLRNHIHLAEKNGIFRFTASKEADASSGEARPGHTRVCVRLPRGSS